VARNKRQLTRTYPAGSRVNSSNYDPVPMWNGGSQFVALNFQTENCDEMNVYRAKFRDNKECGYVLKPLFLRDLSIKFDPLNPATFDAKAARVLKITIISAQNLPKPLHEVKGEIIDPYVIVKVHGVDQDNKTVETSVVLDNGFNPVWNTEFTFNLSVPDLALVHVQVWDKDELSMDDFIGQCVVPFNSLRTGYRQFHLRFADERPISYGAVFAKISIS